MSNIVYPYLPEGRTFIYVPADNPFMLEAKEVARKESLDKGMPVGIVIVKDGKGVVAQGANGSSHHEKHGCERKRLGCKTGEGYELCEGCHPKNHAEIKALASARAVPGLDAQGTDVYMWGHWWCCEGCWKAMDAAGIRNVYLMEGSETLFKLGAPGNIIGRQFE